MWKIKQHTGGFIAPVTNVTHKKRSNFWSSGPMQVAEAGLEARHTGTRS